MNIIKALYYLSIYMKFEFDIIVIGAGHAGCEAAAVSANLGSSTLLITHDLTKIATASVRAYRLCRS